MFIKTKRIEEHIEKQNYFILSNSESQTLVWKYSGNWNI